MPELMDLAAAAALLGVGRSTVVFLIDRGDLEVFWVPSARGKRLERYVRRDVVERLQADESWRRREKRTNRP